MLKILTPNRSVLQSKISRIIAGNIWFCQIHKEPSALHDQERKTQEIVHIPISVGLKAFEENRDYILTFTDIIKDLIQVDDCQMQREAKGRLIEVLKYTTPYGKQNEGLGIVNAYKQIESSRNLTQKNIKLAYVMAWCYAMQSASLIMDDDMMDREVTRQGYPCWYTLDNIGLTAINDSMLIDRAVFYILKKYFSQHNCYIPTIELFHESTYKLALAQALDVTVSVNGKPKFKDFTRERYTYLAHGRGGVYCYECLLKLAMYLAGIFDFDLHNHISRISREIGILFIVHNDLQDAFGEVKVIGRKSTDISNGRCTWPAIEALERGTPAQKQLFMEHYGSSSSNSVQIIKDLYRELKLVEVYKNLEKKTIISIYKDVEQISDRVPKVVFDTLLADVTL